MTLTPWTTSSTICGTGLRKRRNGSFAKVFWQPWFAVVAPSLRMSGFPCCWVLMRANRTAQALPTTPSAVNSWLCGSGASSKSNWLWIPRCKRWTMTKPMPPRSWTCVAPSPHCQPKSVLTSMTARSLLLRKSGRWASCLWSKTGPRNGSHPKTKRLRSGTTCRSKP